MADIKIGDVYHGKTQRRVVFHGQSPRRLQWESRYREARAKKIVWIQSPARAERALVKPKPAAARASQANRAFMSGNQSTGGQPWIPT